MDRVERAWVAPAIEKHIADETLRYAALGAETLEAELAAAIAANEQLQDRDCINLYAGTNQPNPRATKWLSASIGARPSLGHPGDKYETGMWEAEKLELMATAVLRKLFDCRHVEFRVASGSLANLYGFMATTRPGDTILAFPAEAAGHVTHHREGAAGLYGLDIHPVPYDAARMNIDLDGLERAALRLKPKLIVIAGSMCLYPFPVAAVRKIAERVGAWLMYDAAHMSGLIAGGEFQKPLKEGAHIVTMSTYKSFGGPAGGLVLTDDDRLAERLDKIAYPGLTANFDLARTAALIVSVLDLLEHGSAYAKACIANARALAAALDQQGIAVHRAEGCRFTESHHVALPAHRHDGGMKMARLLEQANILASGIGLPLPAIAGEFNALRLGTQEVTRLGMTPAEMPDIATLMARVLKGSNDPAQVKNDVIALRRRFTLLHYVR